MLERSETLLNHQSLCEEALRNMPKLYSVQQQGNSQQVLVVLAKRTRFKDISKMSTCIIALQRSNPLERACCCVLCSRTSPFVASVALNKRLKHRIKNY
jgi:hypothetical protein